jgi:hypothetical protein
MQMRGKHKNSIEAFQNMIKTGARRTICLRIYQAMLGMPAMTERQVSSRMKFGDIYTVRRRMSELIRDGIFVEDGETIDTTTNKTVRLVRISTKGERERHVYPDNPEPSLKEIKDELKKMFEAEYRDAPAWRKHYSRLQQMVNHKGDTCVYYKGTGYAI